MTTKRNGALSFWAFIFCMIIVVHYAYFFKPSAAESASFFFYRGDLAFDFFFILAGVLLAKSVNAVPEDRPLCAKEFGGFLKGRLRWYLPGLALCWIGTFIVLNYVCRIDAKTTATNFFAGVLELLPLHGAGFEIMPAEENALVGYRVMDQAWALAAVMLAYFVLYPLYRSDRKRFEYYIAPVGAALLLAFLFFRTHVLSFDKVLLLDAKSKLMYLFPPGTYKVFGEVLAGAACYAVARHFSKKPVSKGVSHLLSLAEIGCYLGAILYMQFMLRFEIPKRYDYLAAGCILLGIFLSLSGQSSVSRLFDHKFFYALGRFSLYPFLTFMVFTKTLPYFIHGMGMKKLTLIYVGLTLASAVVVMLLEKPFVRLVKSAKKLFIGSGSAKTGADLTEKESV